MSLNPLSLGMFQFQIGPIGSSAKGFAISWRFQVSIPDWSDWQDNYPDVYAELCQVSIPDWSDWQDNYPDVYAELCQVSIPDWSDWQKTLRPRRRPSETGFNSRLVRLAGEIRSLITSHHLSFQFQIGPIGRPIPVRSQAGLISFQFQIGPIGSQFQLRGCIAESPVSIPDWSDWQLHWKIDNNFPILSFNSRLVRLAVRFVLLEEISA